MEGYPNRRLSMQRGGARSAVPAHVRLGPRGPLDTWSAHNEPYRQRHRDNHRRRGADTSRWVAIDFETASRERASACALGLAVIEDGFVVHERAWLIQPPGNYFEPMNTRIHGIDEDLVAQEPEFDGVWAQIGPYLCGATLLAHNASFDIAVLRASLARYEMEPLHARGYLCTVSMARKVWPQLQNHRLDCVCGHCGIDLRHHDAASDASACARIALLCASETGAPTLEDLTERLGMVPRQV